MALTVQMDTTLEQHQACLADAAVRLLGEIPHLGFATGCWLLAFCQDGHPVGIAAVKGDTSVAHLMHLAMSELDDARFLLAHSVKAARDAGFWVLLAPATGPIKATQFIAAGFVQHVHPQEGGDAVVWKKDLLS